jgi:ABC-type branched-subunit amino acid transport system ATPase component/ABC-type branched-subunit amino acid transport system permease subunit
MINILGWELTIQALLIGVVSGLGYGLAAIGVVLIHRATGVVNLAQTEIGTFGAALFALLTVKYGLDYWLALPVALAAGAVWGLVVDVVVMRRLLRVSRLAAFVGTVGVGALVFVAAFSLPRVQGSSSFPTALPKWMGFEVGSSLSVQSRHLALLLLVVPVVAILAVVLRRTRFGLAIRAAAESGEIARLTGVNPANLSTAVWSIASAFAVLSAIAVAPLTGFTGNASQQTGPALLLRILVVALLARMTSLPMCLAGGAVVGVVEALALRNLQSHPGAVEFLLFVAMLLVVLVTTSRRREDGDWTTLAVRQGIPPSIRGLRRWRGFPRMAAATGFIGLVLVPLLWTKASQLQMWTTVLLMATIAVATTMLAGWAGQLSLGQFALAGLGGLSGAVCLRGDTLEIGNFAFSLHLNFFGATVVAAVMGGVGAAIVGLPALRVRGLLLSVTTLSFAAASFGFLFRLDVWSDGKGYVAPLARPSIGSFSLASPRAYFWLCLVVLIVTAVAIGRLRRIGPGRLMVAMRDNESAVAAASISPRRVKLSAFALSGAVAGIAGFMFVVLQPGFTPDAPFEVKESLRIIAVVVIGGLGSVVGAVLGAVWVFGLPAIFGNNPSIEAITSGAGLLIVQLYLPGGFGGVALDVRDRVWAWVLIRHASSEPTERPKVAGVAVRSVRERDATTRSALELVDVSVLFGGVAAVDGLNLEVPAGQLIGVIGANGAGKTTLMNAIGGFVPATGTIRLHGDRIEHLSSAERHARGLGRTFQNARSYPTLTVREAIMVALETRGHSHLVPSLMGAPGARRREKGMASRADDIIAFVGLSRYSSHAVGSLSTGTRRILELACLLAGGGSVLMLDEPTAGVAQREAEAFGPLIRRVQHELAATVMLIEHDVPLVMAISDRVVCMELGRLIADGPPDSVRADGRVIASYLGTDVRAVERSRMDRDDKNRTLVT